jgi:Zn-dependent protease with chaperone function
MNKTKKILHGLINDEYEHPFDKKALNALESTPGLGAVGKFVTKNTVEKFVTIQYTGSCLKVTAKNYPRLYDYLDYASTVLDVDRKPELYIQWGYDINAFTTGAENPIMVLNSGLLDLCTEDEILFIIGHECGHIKSNHMLYHMMAQLINNIIDMVPGGNFVAFPLKFALFYWSRMSEFTADRAGLLCCQNMKAVVSAFIKMSGLPIQEYCNIDPKSFIEQAEKFKELDYENLNKIIKTILIAQADHPWTVMRAGQLINWVNTGDVKEIMLKH